MTRTVWVQAVWVLTHLADEVQIPFLRPIGLCPGETSSCVTEKLSSSDQAVDGCPALIHFVFGLEWHALNQVFKPKARVKAEPCFLQPALNFRGDCDRNVTKVSQRFVVDDVDDGSSDATYRTGDVWWTGGRIGIVWLLELKQNRWSVFTILAPILLCRNI